MPEEEARALVTRWRLSRDLVLTAISEGVWSARSGVSRQPVHVSDPLRDVLGLFHVPRSIDAVRDLGKEACKASGEDVEAAFDAWIASGLIVPAEGGSAAARAALFGDPRIHVLMLIDEVRTRAFRAAVERHAPGRVMLEIGSGSGALACFAARAGAKHVYAIEETQMIEIARSMARDNGVADRITFLAGNSRDVELPEKVDVVFGELIGTNPLEEGILTYLRDARERFLKPAGRLIPAALSVRVCGVDSTAVRRFELADGARALAAEALAAMLQLSAEPLSRAVGQESERDVRVRRVIARFADPASGTVLTDEATLASFDLTRLDAPAPFTAGARLTCMRAGMLNAVAVFFDVQVDDDEALTTAPHAPAEPASWGGQFVQRMDERAVTPGDRLELAAAIDPFHAPQLTLLDGTPAQAGPRRLESAAGRVWNVVPGVVPAADAWTSDGIATALLDRVLYGFTRDYREAIRRAATGRIVLEVGSHGAVLACWAAKAGARCAYAAIEDRHRRLAEALIAANDLDGRVRLVAAGSLDGLEEQVDVLVGEIGPHGPLGDRLLAQLADAAARVLKPGGMIIPSEVEILACAAHAPDVERKDSRRRARLLRLAEFAQRHDLVVDALAEAFSAHPLTSPEPEHVVSLTRTASVAKFQVGDAAGPIRTTITETALRDGLHNALWAGFTARLDELTSIGTDFSRSDDRPRGRLLTRSAPHQVRAGDRIHTPVEITVSPEPAISVEQWS